MAKMGKLLNYQGRVEKFKQNNVFEDQLEDDNLQVLQFKDELNQRMMEAEEAENHRVSKI
jgi:hypothetical protein